MVVQKVNSQCKTWTVTMFSVRKNKRGLTANTKITKKKKKRIIFTKSNPFVLIKGLSKRLILVNKYCIFILARFCDVTKDSSLNWTNQKIVQVGPSIYSKQGSHSPINAHVPKGAGLKGTDIVNVFGHFFYLLKNVVN